MYAGNGAPQRELSTSALRYFSMHEDKDADMKDVTFANDMLMELAKNINSLYVEFLGSHSLVDTLRD